MEIHIKPLLWLGDSKRCVREFPHEARQRVGFEMWEVQQGHEPSDWKPMQAVGQGVNEVRVHVKGEYRVRASRLSEEDATDVEAGYRGSA
jgi:phage-related protein